MKRNGILGGFLIVLLLAPALTTPGGAQEKASFDGTWVATTDAPPEGLAAAPGAIMGARFGLNLEGETLSMTRVVREESRVVRYKMDGSRTSHRVSGRMCEGDSEFIETVAREGEAIVLTGVGRVPPGGGAPQQLNVRRILRLHGADALVVEASISQGGTSRQVGTVYKRSAEALPPQADAGMKGVSATIAQVAWISGFWSGDNNNSVVEERWTPQASGSILGLGRRLRGTLMSSFEFLCINEREGSLVYTAMPDGRTTPTHFTLTSITAESATFENPKHDYPKLVRYTLKPDGSLETTISGAANQRTLSFVLQRKQ